MKKIISILIAFAMVFSLVGCNDSSEGDIDTSSVNLNYFTDESESKLEDATVSDDNVSENLDKTNTSSNQNTSSTQNTSSNQNTATDNTSKPTNNIKPYTGNLPSVSVGKIPQFAERKFEISGFWAPYEISEESFKQYKDVGFTTLAMINHSLSNTSKNQFYLGSERTMKALEVCRKVGLKAILNYNDWKAEQCEGKGYIGNTPFSKYDLYEDYKDIITGIHICDEPHVHHIEEYGNKTLIEDFKKVYPNTKYIVNLIPFTAYPSRGFETYGQMMEMYEKAFMEPFSNPFVSVDVYPFHNGSEQDDGTLAYNYEYIANSAKKYGVKPAFILQSSVGGGEFETELSEKDLRWEINAALAYGADTLQYYCYSVPKSVSSNGQVSSMYDYCILNLDDTPSPIYYHLQKLHKEIQSFSDIILAYDWDESIGLLGNGKYAGRVSLIAYDKDFNYRQFKNPKHFVSADAAEETVISRFTNEKYGEAYMIVNFADRIENSVTATFRDCKALAIYNSKTGATPKIVSLDKNGQAKIDLEYGDGVFVIPLV